MSAKTQSIHEFNFDAHWRAMGGPELQSEFEFSDDAGWKFDFAHADTMIAFEIQGGVWRKGGGAHQGKGFERDCEKFLEANLLGWRVIALHPKQIEPVTIQRLIKWVNEQI